MRETGYVNIHVRSYIFYLSLFTRQLSIRGFYIQKYILSREFSIYHLRRLSVSPLMRILETEQFNSIIILELDDSIERFVQSRTFREHLEIYVSFGFK